MQVEELEFVCELVDGAVGEERLDGLLVDARDG